MARESAATIRVREARSALLLTHPFFGVLSLKLDLVEDTGTQAFCVTSKVLKFNPEYVESLSNAELKGSVAHEVFHLGLLHHAREGNREHQMWNDACDYAINSNLIADGFTLPKGVCVDSRFDGKSAEQIYTILRDEKQEQEPEQDGNKPQSGAGAGNPCGSFESAGPEESAEAEESAREWQENANEAMRAASSAGKLPAGIKLQVTAALVAKADWRVLLRRFMTDQLKTRSTWSKRNKRFSEVYLPGKIADGMGSLVVAVDTSGSITQATLDRFAAEISGICEDVEPAQTHIVYCDAWVNRVDTFEAGEPVKLSLCGGGGTRFMPVFDHVQAENWQPAALVYLTDLEGPDFPADPGYPVLWASYGARGAVAPVGETIAID